MDTSYTCAHHHIINPPASFLGPQLPITEEEFSSSFPTSYARLDTPEKQTTHQDGSRYALSSRMQFLLSLLRSTGAWIAGGIGLMLLGIALVQIFFLPRIYVCPDGATCPRSFDPRSNVLQLLQTFMQYWLQLGTILAGFGLGQLIGYQSWLSMKLRGNTIGILDLTIGALKGSAYDAWMLLAKKRNCFLAWFVLAQIAICTAISLAVGLSISSMRMTRRVRITFSYPQNIVLPNGDYQFNANGWRAAIDEMDRMLFHPHTKGNVSDTSVTTVADPFQGTFIIRDNRTVYAVNAQPSGPRIMGDVSCAGLPPNASVTVKSALWSPDERDYTLSLPDLLPLANAPLTVSSSTRLAVGMFYITPPTAGDTQVFTRYIWASNTTGVIPNAILTSDGGMHFAICDHSIWLSNIPKAGGEGAQYIEPSDPTVNLSKTGSLLCQIPDGRPCAMYMALKLVETWWASRPSPNGLQPLTCENGVLSPFDDNGRPCRVDRETWTLTLGAMLDAMVQTSEKAGSDQEQVLLSRAESISTRRWWVQGSVPLSVFLLYVVCLAYTCTLCPWGGRGDSCEVFLRELNLVEVVAAAHTEEAKSIVRREGVTRSMKVGETL